MDRVVFPFRTNGLMSLLLLLVVITFCSSCSLFGPKFTKTTFSYTANGVSHSVPVIVPKGFRTAKNGTDSSGSGVLFDYGKSIFYVAYVIDTSLRTEFVDPEVNIPLPHPLGGSIYKGLSQSGFWREIRRGNLRVGYQNVSKSGEFAFDSASNYVSNNFK